MSVLVRLMGLTMLVIGLFVGIKVIFEAWNLYEEPQRIERFADAIEHGSHLDSLLNSLTPKSISNNTTEAQHSPNSENQSEQLKVTYFLAWFVAILLLMVVGGLASRAIKTGGELALYDLQVKRFAKLLMREVRQADDE